MKKYTSQIEKATARIAELKAGSKKFTAEQLQSKLSKLQRAIDKENEKAADDAIEGLDEFYASEKEAVKARKEEEKLAATGELENDAAGNTVILESGIEKAGPKVKSNPKKA